ncbi:hypothetical protein AB9X29_003749 [Vibrio vulnificus]
MQEKIEEVIRNIQSLLRHVAFGGEVQTFYQVCVVTKTDSLTYHDSFATDWFLIKNDKLYVCDENGECVVEFSSDYEGETLTLTPLSRIEICVNERDLSVGYAVADFAKNVIHRVFGINVASVPIVNVA